MSTNPYEILQVSPDASPAQIEEAFRRRASHQHPSKGGDPHKFATLVQAYKTIQVAHQDAATGAAATRDPSTSSQPPEWVLAPKGKATRLAKTKMRSYHTALVVGGTTSLLLLPGALWILLFRTFTAPLLLAATLPLITSLIFSREIFLSLFFHRTRTATLAAGFALLGWFLWLPAGAAMLILFWVIKETNRMRGKARSPQKPN